MSDSNSAAASASEPKVPETRHVESDHGEIAQVLEVVGNRAKVVHADGTIDYVDTHALGGEAKEMPSGYFRSAQFIGTVAVCEMPDRDSFSNLRDMN